MKMQKKNVTVKNHGHIKYFLWNAEFNPQSLGTIIGIAEFGGAEMTYCGILYNIQYVS